MSISRLASICCLTLLSTSLAHAGMAHRDCRFPMVFEGAAVNVVVLPYRYAGGHNDSLTNMGNRLSLLVKLDVLSHILEYGSVGAVQMEMPEGTSSDDPSCLPDTVMPKLLGPKNGPVTPLAPGHGLVLVWGLLYEENEDVFVQTYARFLRRDVDEGLTFQAGGLPFSAKPSSQLVAFTPQKLTQTEIQQVEDSFRRANLVRSEPTDSAPGDQLPDLVAKCAGCDDTPVHAGFYVQEKKGEWIRIQYMDPIRDQRKEGWIHAAGGLQGTPLDRVLPELHFIEGCAGYLRQRVAEADQTPLPPAAITHAIDELNSFVKANDTQPNDIVNAVALQLAGIVEFTSGRTQIESLTRAAQDFEQARRMIPYDPNAINLAVGGQVVQEWKQQGRCEQTALKAQRFSTAGAFSSADASLTNLNNFYNLLLKSPDSPQTAENLSKEQVRHRLNATSSVTYAK